MNVIADFEWIERAMERYPTQLAAIRVNLNGQIVSEFKERIRPEKVQFYHWNHVAYAGGGPEDFLQAAEAEEVFECFANWLEEDDVLCWWAREVEEVFHVLYKRYTGSQLEKKCVIVRESLAQHLQNENIKKRSAYTIAKEKGIEVPPVQHDAYNDVMAIQQLLAGVSFKMEDLESAANNEQSSVLYWASLHDRLIHRSSCPVFDCQDPIDVKYNIKFFPEKKYRPCKLCCGAEVEEWLIRRNQERVQKSDWRYVYDEKGQYFHKRDCDMWLKAEWLTGCCYYTKAVAKGKQPCPVCQPSIQDDKLYARKINSKEYKKEEENNWLLRQRKEFPTINRLLSAEELRALKRLKMAKKERYSQESVNRNFKSQKDFYSLTQSGQVFWAARGYSNFHIRSCRKLNGLSNLQGFSSYKEAVKAGFKPCRQCKPSAKQDMVVSFPIYSREKENETVEDLVRLCREWGARYKVEASYFYLETSVGQWKIDTKTRPIRALHNNLVKSKGIRENYHMQPRLFLSFEDVFRYIRNHDEELLRKKQASHSEG